MRKILFAMALVVLLSLVFSGYFYEKLPERVAIHWNAEGVADGFADKDLGVFGVPALSVLLLVLFIAIPRIDPLKENIKKFEAAYWKFVFLLLAFMVYVHLLTIAYNLGASFSFTQALAPALGVLLFAMGSLIAKAKRNYLVGIRTPWTLASDNVWEKTHKLGALLFKASGAITFLGVFFPGAFIYLVLVPVLGSAAVLIVYSYLEYAKEKR